MQLLQSTAQFSAAPRTFLSCGNNNLAYLLTAISGYTTNIYGQCLSSFGTSTTISSIISKGSDNFWTLLPPLSSATTFLAVSVTSWTVVHAGVVLEYVSTTLPASTSAPAGNSSGPPSSPSSGLSAGANAGIGVGVALIILIIVAVIILFLRRRRKGNRKIDIADPTPELENKSRAELPEETARAELIASKLYPSHELKGSLPADGVNGPERAPLELAAGDVEGRDTSPQRQDNVRLEEGQPHDGIDHINASTASTQVSGISNVDRSKLATRELEWLEQEEARIREQKARILAQSRR